MKKKTQKIMEMSEELSNMLISDMKWGAEVRKRLEEKYARTKFKNAMVNIEAHSECNKAWTEKFTKMWMEHSIVSFKEHVSLVIEKCLLILLLDDDKDFRKALASRIVTDTFLNRVGELCAEATIMELTDFLKKNLPKITAMNMMILNVDSDAIRGRKIMHATQHGHETVHGNLLEKEARWKKYQEEFEILRSEYPNPPYSNEWCYQKLAKQFGVCPKTIKRRISQK